MNGSVDIDQPALAKDSFRQWRKIMFRYHHEVKQVQIFKKSTSTKPFLVFLLPSVSLSVAGNVLEILRPKSSPVFVQFETEELAQHIYDYLKVIMTPLHL